MSPHRHLSKFTKFKTKQKKNENENTQTHRDIHTYIYIWVLMEYMINKIFVSQNVDIFILVPQKFKWFE